MGPALALLILPIAAAPAKGPIAMTGALAAMPDGYHLQRFDDCGVTGRQPHTIAEGVHEYSPGAVNADQRSRTVAWGWREVRAAYTDLDPALDYVLAVTYCNEPYNHRVQSLWAGELQIHGPHELPKGGTERLLFRLPRACTAGGRLELSFRLEAQVNVVVSAIELWAAAPSPVEVHLTDVFGLWGDLEGTVVDLGYDPLPGAAIFLRRAGGEVIAETTSGPDGRFRLPRERFDGAAREGPLELGAHHEGAEVSRTLTALDLVFDPVQYRPIPTRVCGLSKPVVSLDGDWRIQTPVRPDVRQMGLDDPAWAPFIVPGQWVQQGHDVPTDQPVAVATEFRMPPAWSGHRVVLRFDGVHGGARYWINGHYLGASENLFTPVEWDITDAVRVGDANRLDMEMVVDTVSERLAYASGYAFHNLGGIDRSVRLIALPQTHLRSLTVEQTLDDALTMATIRVRSSVARSGSTPAANLRLELRLRDERGRPVAVEGGISEVEPARPGARAEASAQIAHPLLWSAEKPHLYRLTVRLLDGDTLLEEVERSVGFRRIEIRGAQLFVNSQRVKLAGACHHEIDPLTGRAATARHAEEDVRLAKGANLDYLRTSHYPPTEELLDAADRLGVYLEVEAPFCWVSNDTDPEHLRAVLTPTSAMVDAAHSHPSVLLWSIANESQYNPLFEISTAMVKQLDPSRPTTFNNPDPKQIADIANLHYAAVPYEQHLQDDPRPMLLGEYFFPICHEQTDVAVDPGLRELWGAGHRDPSSEWGRDCAESFGGPFLQPGLPPGTWSDMVRSDRVIGGAIWAFLDEPFYLPGGKKVGYAWHHGFWGLVDAWRRPKPEWWLAKQIFSPVWFVDSMAPFSGDEESVRVRVENRYAFTDFAELEFASRTPAGEEPFDLSLAPGASAAVAVPVPRGSRRGQVLQIEARGRGGDLVTIAAIVLGEREHHEAPAPDAGCPRLTDEGSAFRIEGDGFVFVVDKTRGKLADGSVSALVSLPTLHLTRFDFGDLAGPNAAPYEVLPQRETRQVERVTAETVSEGVMLTIRERFEGFSGETRWLIDRAGVGRVAYDYIHSGPELAAREIGVRMLLRRECQSLSWRRWSEWGAYPADSISRVEGTASAHREPGGGPDIEGTPPRWPWALDETELGTTDFRSVKLNVYRASLKAPNGQGVALDADADAHVRACLAPGGVWMHLLKTCRLGPVTVHDGDRLQGEFALSLLAGRS